MRYVIDSLEFGLDIALERWERDEAALWGRGESIGAVVREYRARVKEPNFASC